MPCSLARIDIATKLLETFLKRYVACFIPQKYNTPEFLFVKDFSEISIPMRGA